VKIEIASPSLAEAAVDLLVVGVGSENLDEGLAPLVEVFGPKLRTLVQQRNFKGSVASTLVLPGLDTVAARDVLIVGTGKGTRRHVSEAVGRAGREARALRASSAALFLDGDAAHLAETFRAGNYKYQAYTKPDERKPAVEHLVLAGASGSHDASEVRGRWQDWARDLVNAPPADVYPESLAEHAVQAFSGLPHVEVEGGDADHLAEEDCVGILAVGQGSSRPPVMIRVSYRPPNARDHVAFVGKGVTFDAGGLSIKPSGGMQTMRCDMGGSAVVLGATGAAAELGLPVAIDCFVGAAENMVDGNSYKLGDILRYRNGVNVEIHNTDAEGRLVMADCLIRASEVDGVSAIIDAATLTGACVVAVGDEFTGLFTGDEDLASQLLDAASATDEGLWRLPLHDRYDDQLSAEWGTIKNVGSRYAGATTAALFLRNFVRDDVAWAHLDVAGPAFLDKASPRYVAGATGEMVRTLATWLASRG
jgi:leucyl aminopeptidase